MIHNLLRRIQAALLLFASVLLLTAADTLPAPPIAKKVPHVTDINGHKLTDNYFWLRDKPNPEVRAYLEAENAYTDAVMKPTEPFQKKLLPVARSMPWVLRVRSFPRLRLTRESSSIRSVVSFRNDCPLTRVTGRGHHPNASISENPHDERSSILDGAVSD